MTAKRAWGAEIQNREEKFELKRQAVLLTAARMIRRWGYEKTSLGDIADELQIAKPTVYYYFRNKEQIVDELMEIAIGSFLDPTDHPEDYPNAPGLNGAARLTRLLRRCVRVVTDDIGSSLLMIYPHQMGEQLRAKIRSRSESIDVLTEEILHAGIADGSIAPCNVNACYLLIVGALRYIPIWQSEQHMSSAQVADSLVQLILNGLAAQPASA
jgi:AcrR family transcriptional regulator